MEQKVLIFDKQYINKNVFHKNRRPINIDNAEIRRIVLSNKIHMLKKVQLNILLGI